MKFTISIFFILMMLGCNSKSAFEIYTSPNGGSKNTGNKNDPVSFEVAIERASEQLEKGNYEGITINVLGGHYRFVSPVVLGKEFKGTEKTPIIIKSVEGEKVIFDGSVLVDIKTFEQVSDANEKSRLAKKAANNIVVATIIDETMIRCFNENIMLNLSFNGNEYLPSVFPNEGYATFLEETVKEEITPPAVPVGKEAHGIRAGHVPFLEKGKSRAWKGDLKEPRGARAKFANKVEEMAGTWQQWENEIKRNNTRNQLTGFIEASWLLSSQGIYSASAKDECVHLSRALGYGWAWRKNDKPFRVFGMLCEVDAPGEWHFDPITNRLFLYPPEPLTQDTKISLAVADGFMELKDAEYIKVIGLSVQNVGSGSVYNISGENNLVADCSISKSTATGVHLDGKNNSVVSCDLFDLNMHAHITGGVASSNEITAANNKLENCHIYQREVKHQKINILMTGCGNIFRNNLVHNSIGQAMIVNGNEQIVELNEFFNIGFEEGDGGAVYSGNDLGGYGNIYRFNFFHHLMHCPGKVARAGIHLDDGQSGATCYGNLFYKSAAKGIFTFGGAGHTIYDNVLLEGERGVYMVQVLGEKYRKMEKEIRKDPKHHRRGTKEDYVGRVETRIGENAWADPVWKEKYPTFNLIMSDTTMFGRFWPIYNNITNNYSYKNTDIKIVDYRVEPEALAKCRVEEYKAIQPSDFVDYKNLNLEFKEKDNFPKIPFSEIGLKLDNFRTEMPDKMKYRSGIKDFFKGIGSMPGTKKQIDTSKLIE